MLRQSKPKEFLLMNHFFSPITRRSGNCCGPISGFTGDVRLSFVHSVREVDSARGQYWNAGLLQDFIPMNDHKTDGGALRIT